MREIKFKYIWQYQETGRITSTIISLDDLENVAKESNCISFLTKLLPERLYTFIDRCEFTGLHDKNGKEIFKGDILKSGDDIGKVIFSRGAFMVQFDEDDFEYLQDIMFEKIGDIHNNPELLTQ